MIGEDPAAIHVAIKNSVRYLVSVAKPRKFGGGPSPLADKDTMSSACDALRSGVAVGEVAASVGYLSASAFSHAFKQRLGCSPAEWAATQGAA